MGCLGQKPIHGNCWMGSFTPSKNLRVSFIKIVKTSSTHTNDWISKMQDTHSDLKEIKNYFEIISPISTITIDYGSTQWELYEVELNLPYNIYWLYCVNAAAQFHFLWDANSFTFPGVINMMRLSALYHLSLCTLTLLPACQLTWERSSHVTLQKGTYKGSSLSYTAVWKIL